jgi:hypothetical protein
MLIEWTIKEWCIKFVNQPEVSQPRGRPKPDGGTVCMVI